MTTAAVLLVPLLLQPPLDRSRLPVPPVRVFESMLRFAADGDADRIQRSLDLLAAVRAEHARVLGPGNDLQFAGTDAAQLLTAVRRLIARDVIVLLRGLREAPAERTRTMALTAKLEWGLLEPDVARLDSRAGQAISAQMRDLTHALEEKDLDAVGALVGRIESNLRTWVR